MGMTSEEKDAHVMSNRELAQRLRIQVANPLYSTALERRAELLEAAARLIAFGASIAGDVANGKMQRAQQTAWALEDERKTT